jgi:threonine synthase
VITLELTCPRCHRTYSLNLFTKNCEQCGSTLLVNYDYEAVKESFKDLKNRTNSTKIWKFLHLLPLGEGKEQLVSLGEGGTFLQKCDRLAKECGIRRLYLKNETTNPTGSFMDRGVAVELSEAAYQRIKSVECAPTGNLGASLAGYAARAGMRCILHVSSDVNPGKLLQMIAYDAEVKLNSNSPSEIDDKQSFWVTPVDPYLLEGEKTIIFEICEQLGWRTPSRIIAPVGTGGLFTMLWKGLQELTWTGLIEDDGPRMTGVQAAGCDPVVTAFEGHCEKVKPVNRVETLAVDLKVPNPPLGEMVLEAIEKSSGSAIAVSDEEILDATRLLAKTEGVFAEPAAASTVAALRKMVEEKNIDPSEEVVCIITGAGLKDPSATVRLLDRQRRLKFLVERRNERGFSNSLGDTKIKILKVLQEGETYGYGIWKALDEEYGVRVKIPSVYQHLSELAALGLVEKGGTIEGRGKPPRRFLMLTPQGRETLETLAHLRARDE